MPLNTTLGALSGLKYLIGAISLLAVVSLSAAELANTVPGVVRDGRVPAQEAYVWQRNWTPSLKPALREHGPKLDRLVVLAAQVSWQEGRPAVTRAPVDYALLADIGTPVGLALRIESYGGPFSSTNRTTTWLCNLAQALVHDAEREGVKPTELQLDFDCAESKLAGYQNWVQAIRDKINRVPLTLTALPAWLGQPSFKPLVTSADSYVLQVHALERPRVKGGPWILCDPAAARQAVARAATVGHPFRVALPTYGYLVATDRAGRFLGVSAEGPQRTWPANTRLQEVWANPVEMAQLVREWTETRPSSLLGFIYYRFPHPEDTLNWRWPTLAAIMSSQIPQESVQAESRRVEAGLVEISLVNKGEIDISSRLAIKVRWQKARMNAGDGLGGFELAERERNFAQFISRTKPFRLPAGETTKVGWLRLSEDSEVQVELERMAE